MKILRRLLGAKVPTAREPTPEEKATQQLLMRERQEYRQIVQRLESGVRVMNTWESAIGMLNRGKE